MALLSIQRASGVSQSFACFALLMHARSAAHTWLAPRVGENARKNAAPADVGGHGMCVTRRSRPPMSGGLKMSYSVS